MTRALLAGVADTPVGRLSGTSTMALAAAAVRDAVSDWGGTRDDLDGLITVTPMVGAHPRQALALAEQLGIAPNMRWLSTAQLGGASALAGVVEATRLVREGVCSSVVVVAADTPRTGTERASSVAAFGRMRHPDWEQPYGLTNVGAYALLADAYLQRHGLSEDCLAEAPVALRAMAQLNPSAVYREPLSREEVLESPLVASPLRKLECSPISDGGGAIVVAREGAGPELVSWGMGFRYDHISFADAMPATGCAIAARRALGRAGVQPSDFDVGLLYDSYSITLMIELEELGLCPPGEAAAFIAAGETGLGGSIPVNTHGGLLSHSHCGSAAGIHHLTEAVRQLRGESSAQVEGAELALVHAEGGILSANCTAVLAR